MESMIPELGDQRKIYDSEDVIKVDPLEMRFRLDAKNVASSILNLVNFTDEDVAYKISKKNSTIMYATDSIGPQTTCVVKIIREASDPVECDDKFIVQTTVVTDFIDTTDLPDDLFEGADGRRIHEVEVGVIPCQPQLMESNEGTGTSSEETGSKGSTKPFDVHPTQLHVPFEPNKWIPGTLYLTNNTDRFVRFRLKDNREWAFTGELQGCVPPRSNYSLVVIAQRQRKLPWSPRDTMFLHSSICDEESIIHEFDDYVELKLVHTPRGEMIYEATPHGMKIISTMQYASELKSVDANPRQPWVATTEKCDDLICIMNYDTQKPTGQFDIEADREGHEMKLWDWDKDWNLTRTFETEEHTYKLKQIVFNPKASMFNSLASAWIDCTIKFWDLDSSECSHTLFGHEDDVYCLDFFTREEGQQYLVSGSKDKTAKIWDIQKMTCVHTLEGFMSPVLCVIGHPDLPLLITGTAQGLIHVWSSTDFRLKRIFNIGSSGKVLSIALACPIGSKRVVIGQAYAVSVLDFSHEEGQNQFETLEFGELESSGDEKSTITLESTTSTQLSSSGCASGDILDPYVVSPFSGGPASTFGLWMHSVDGGRSGYLQHGWLVAF